jgi:hypothetical protein
MTCPESPGPAEFRAVIYPNGHDFWVFSECDHPLAGKLASDADWYFVDTDPSVAGAELVLINNETLQIE